MRATSCLYRDYMRWDGWIEIAVGIGICTFGFANGHQAPVDALVGGLILTAATGAYMKLRYGVHFREPSTWFITEPVARASRAIPVGTKPRLLGQILSEWTGVVLVAIGLSYL